MQKSTNSTPLDRARGKAYWRLLPLLFLCYVIAYVDRANIAIAKLTMSKDLPAFDNAVIGFGAGLFFWGYFLLEVPGSLLVEKWSARRLISRIMITWGIIAAFTAFVHYDVPGVTPFCRMLLQGVMAVLAPLANANIPWLSRVLQGFISSSQGPEGIYIFQFYIVRFMLGLAEAGFFPGIIVYLTHWFPGRDRTRALSLFLIATPVAQIVSPKISYALLKIGADSRPEFMGLEGWQWVYIVWGIPAVVLGIVVLFFLTDRPRQAKWLQPDEKEALETQIETEKAKRAKGRRMTFGQAFRNWRVMALAMAYFCSTTANYGIEFFLPSILKDWYSLNLNSVTWLVILPPCLALCSQLFVGWNSDRTKERRYHAAFCILIGLIALALAPLTRGFLALTIGCFMLAVAGIKGYQPAFWSLPSLFLTESAAAASIGLINSIGNLGGFMGPTVLGAVQKATGSFAGGIYFLVACMALNVTIILLLGIGKKEVDAPPSSAEVPAPASLSGSPGKA